MRPISLPVAFCLLGAFLLTGCARTSPAVGTWTATRGAVTATITLKEDGTGTFAVPAFGNPADLKWTLEDKVVALNVNSGTGPQNLTGTLSEDNTTMTLTAGPMTLDFKKQADAK